MNLLLVLAENVAEGGGVDHLVAEVDEEVELEADGQAPVLVLGQDGLPVGMVTVEDEVLAEDLRGDQGEDEDKEDDEEEDANDDGDGDARRPRARSSGSS